MSDDKTQHIVGQSRKPCLIVSQQVEDCRHFALGLGTDIDRRAVTAIHRREECAFEIRQRDLFTPESGRLLSSSRLGADVCFFSSRCRYSGYRFRCVSLGSVRIFLFRLGNPADDFRVQRSLSGDHLTHQLLIDFDTGMLQKDLLQVCQFLLMNPWYNVFEIEYSLYGHKASCVWFYVLNHSKYRFLFNTVYIGIMNGIRKLDLSCCKIQPTEIPRFRCPLTDRSSPHRWTFFSPVPS